MTALPCPPAHWSAFSRRLDALLALAPADRAAALDALPPDEAVLRPWLAAVLARQDDALDDAWLTGPRLSAPGAADSTATAHQPGQRIGPWQLLRELGRGGMGVVWLAARADGAYVREVALKLPHRHLLENLNAAGVRARFARERDILAALSHPHIARFYDAGVTDDQQPWLALEAVDGLPITAWCRQHALPLDARLALFDQVAGAVAHAHGRLVAHRDLKPANVLVAADGQVKLLDFGIARLLEDADGTGGAADDGAGALTRAQGLLATPQYAAPEQLAGGPVSVATDVYALGLMLFELLTDQPAFAGRRNDPLAEAPAASRSAGTPALRRALAGDLDAIVAQALQPRPEARYPSVAALADDLQRHRHHLPITARRLGPAQRLGRFVRRHRLPVALGGALALALGAGLAGVLWQAQEARAQARRAEAVKDFLLGIFSAADPRVAGGQPGGQITAKALLDRSAARIDAQFVGDPDLRIELLRTAADIYRELGEDSAYDALQARQRALLLDRHGPLHPQVLTARIEAAAVARERGQPQACLAQLAQIDADLRRAGLDDSPQRALWWQTDSVCRRGIAADAARRLTALQQAEALWARLAPGQRAHVTVWGDLAVEHLSQRDLAASIAAGQRAIAMSERLPGRNEAELQTLHFNLGLAQGSDGQLAAASASLGRAADIAERTSGIDFPPAWPIRSKQARLLHLGGDRSGAARIFTPLARLLPPPDRAGPDANVAREDQGTCLLAEGQLAAALVLLRQAEQGHQRQPGFDFDLRRVRRQIGDALDKLGRPDEARPLLAASLAESEARERPGSQELAQARERWGRFLLDRNDQAGAEQVFQRVIDQVARPTWVQVPLAQAGLARVALARGDQRRALELSQQALAGWDRRTGRFDVRMQAYLWRVRAAVLAAAGDTAGAQALRDQALAAARRTDAPDSPTITQPLALGL